MRERYIDSDKLNIKRNIYTGKERETKKKTLSKGNIKRDLLIHPGADVPPVLLAGVAVLTEEVIFHGNP